MRRDEFGIARRFWLPLFAVICIFAIATSSGCGVTSGRSTAVASGKTLTLDLGNKVTMKLVQIPPGKFNMGSPKEERDRSDNEGPQREVAISKPFYMGVYDVTQEQYEALMGNNPSNFKGASRPVEMVSWDDAVAFCAKLSDKAKVKVRVPTEAEWEYACRAGSKTRFSFGDDDKQLGDYAWFNGNSSKSTHPVGQKKANAWGLYDMHGNVWQWCSDWYSESYVGAVEKDPEGPKSGQSRVLRGGSCFDSPQNCRSAFRSNGAPDFRDISVGFRVAVDSK